MINNLKIKNFKSIGEEIDIELRPLTIILGPNGSGKSAILESIGLLSQSVEKQTIQTRKEMTLKELIKTIRMARTDQDIERLQWTASDFETQRNNNLIDIPDPINIFHKKDPEKWLTIEIGIKLNNEEIADIVSISSSVGGLDQLFIDNENKVRYIFSYRHEGEFIQTIMIGDSVVIRSQNLIKEKRKDGRSWNSSLEFPLITNNPITSEGKPLIPQGADIILDEKTFNNTTQLTENDECYRIFVNTSTKIVKIIKKYIKNRVFFVSSIRGEIKDKEIDESLNEELLKLLGVGKTGQFLIPVLSMIANRKYEKTYENINKWGAEFLLNKISASWKGKDIYGSDYIEDKFDVLLNLSTASQGSRQILTIITQLFWSDPGSIILIEEPEISLHPFAQMRLIELFSDVISQDKQIIITTHSDFLLKAVEASIKENYLRTEDIAIYAVYKDVIGSKVKKIEINNKGEITGWVPSKLIANLQDMTIEQMEDLYYENFN